MQHCEPSEKRALIDVVLDASVMLHWFAPQDGPTATHARTLLDRLDAGELILHEPVLLYLEIINVAARRHRFSADALFELASRLETLDLDIQEPELSWIATWTSRGLSTYDANYVALADEMEIPLVTADAEVLAAAPEVAYSLDQVAELFAQ